MNIVNKSIRIIDYENETVFSRDTPESFNEYINELVTHINSNDSVREYKTRSLGTQVIGSALQILQRQEDEMFVLEHVNSIANRLLREEIEAQGRIRRMHTDVQKGTLIQALLFDETDDSYTYLLAKVEHSDFVDDADFSFKTGFSKDKKTIWKSCLFDLTNIAVEVINAKIYSNTIAKYWSHGFLELDEMISDESNTLKAFKAIDETLNRNIRRFAPKDYTVIRNSVISYFKGNTHIDYNNMVDTILGQYQPSDLTEEKLSSLRQKLSELPQNKHFDRQFNAVPNVINARIKKIYKVNDGIEIKITDAIEDQTITAFQDVDGTRYIKIKTNNEETYQSFLNNE